MSIKFRHSAGFGRRMEYWLIGKMLKEGLDVYVPLVDDFGIDAVIRKQDGTFIEVQIKARSGDVKLGDAALFAAIIHQEPRKNYYFVFYSERLDAMWIMSSEQFIEKAHQNKNGKNKGSRSIWFNGTKINKATAKKEEYPKEQFGQYLAKDFGMFKAVAGLVVVPRPEEAGSANGLA